MGNTRRQPHPQFQGEFRIKRKLERLESSENG